MAAASSYTPQSPPTWAPPCPCPQKRGCSALNVTKSILYHVSATCPKQLAYVQTMLPLVPATSEVHYFRFIFVDLGQNCSTRNEGDNVCDPYVDASVS